MAKPRDPDPKHYFRERRKLQKPMASAIQADKEKYSANWVAYLERGSTDVTLAGTK
jgi:hypothetical protein